MLFLLQKFSTHSSLNLLQFGLKLRDNQDTADYLRIILTWKFFYVKTPNKGKRPNDIYQDQKLQQYEKFEDPKIRFLNKMLDWLTISEKFSKRYSHKCIRSYVKQFFICE